MYEQVNCTSIVFEGYHPVLLYYACRLLGQASTTTKLYLVNIWLPFTLATSCKKRERFGGICNYYSKFIEVVSFVVNRTAK